MKKLILKFLGIKLKAKSRLKAGWKSRIAQNQPRLSNGRYSSKQTILDQPEERAIPVNYMGKTLEYITLN